MYICMCVKMNKLRKRGRVIEKVPISPNLNAKATTPWGGEDRKNHVCVIFFMKKHN